MATPGLLSAALSGCRAPTNPALRSDERKLVGELAEAVIPTTDTPGALEAGVPDFIEMMLAEFSSDAERSLFRDQLAGIRSRLESAGARRLADLPLEDRRQLMDELDAQAFGDPPDPQAFMATLKAWTVTGYYTSPAGAQKELHQTPFGSWQADIPLDTVGKTWA